MNSPVVKVNQGILKGRFIKTSFGQFISFKGIPYAKPPIGQLRFADPQPPTPWSGIREAINEAGVACQVDFLNSNIIGGDDCLYLNVITKNISGRKPVMVLIHGGGYSSASGNSDIFGSDYFVQHDIVFVSMNYRLGMLGFLNMDMEDCSGNQGLKDQVLALKWIQENIEAFGGDKNNVTIFGDSSGAACAQFLYVSPLGKGLFHKLIAQSGVFLNPWASQTNASNKEYAMKVLAELGCSSTDAKEIVAFLRRTSAEAIVKAQNKGAEKRPFKIMFNFLPTVDNKSSNPVLPRPLSEMVKKSIDVPLIMGYTSHEGVLALGEATFEDSRKTFNDDFDRSLSKDLNLDLNSVSKFSKTVKKFYFGETSITKEQMDNFIQYKGDVTCVAGIWQMLEKQVQKKSPTYLYKFSYPAKHSILKNILQLDVKGSAHADDIGYLFRMSAFPEEMQLQKGTIDYLIMQRMTKMWTNFAKTGNPTPDCDDIINVKWYPYNSKQRACLHITENLIIEENYVEESWKFWKPIFEEFKRI